MTPERLAKVAEVSAGHGDWESVSGGFRCHCGAITFDPDGHTAETLAPMLDEFQAEDEARIKRAEEDANRAIDRRREETARANAAETEAARVRAEYESAITWDTTCLNCAKLLDKLYGEWAEGHKAGYREGAARVREAVEALLANAPQWHSKGVHVVAAVRLRAALDAAEKAAVGGVAGAVSAKDGLSGHGDAGRGSEA